MRPYLRADLAAEEGEAWVGMRPMTPDGLPAIGRLAPWRNAFVSTGHATNGVFTAPASAELLAEIAVRGDAAEIPAFSPLRFTAG